MIELIEKSKGMDQFMNGVTDFIIYFGMSLAFLLAFKWIYMAITPHDEWKEIKENKNTAAAIALGGAVVGYAIAISSAASNSVDWVDFSMWGVIALVAQVSGFTLVRALFMPKIVQRIVDQEVPAAVVLASVSIAVGLLNAACMTY